MERDLRDLLAQHPPPWTEAPAADFYAARDALGNVVAVTIAPELRPCLVAAVNVAADYLEVLDDLLEESAALPATEDPSTEGQAVRSVTERYEAVGS